jgi:hypothetical protein
MAARGSTTADDQGSTGDNAVLAGAGALDGEVEVTLAHHMSAAAAQAAGLGDEEIKPQDTRKVRRDVAASLITQGQVQGVDPQNPRSVAKALGLDGKK